MKYTNTKNSLELAQSMSKLLHSEGAIIENAQQMELYYQDET